MVFRTAKELDANIKGGAPMPLYLLWGEESYQIEKYRNALCACIPDSELMRYDGRALPAVDEIADYALSMSFFGGRRGVLIDDIDLSAIGAEGFEKLLELLTEPEAGTLMVITCRSGAFDPKKDSRSKRLYEICDKNGAVCAFAKLSAADAAKYASSLAAHEKCVLGREEAMLLAEYCASDAVRIANEIAKLTAHSTDGRITKDDIALLVSPTVEANVFRMSELLLRADFGGAMQLIDDLIFLKEEPAMLISMASMAFSDICKANAAQHAGVSSAAAAKSYGINSYRYDKACASARKLSDSQIASILEICAEAELAVKAESANPRIALETAVAQIVCVTGARP